MGTMLEVKSCKDFFGNTAVVSRTFNGYAVRVADMNGRTLGDYICQTVEAAERRLDEWSTTWEEVNGDGVQQQMRLRRKS